MNEHIIDITSLILCNTLWFLAWYYSDRDNQLLKKLIKEYEDRPLKALSDEELEAIRVMTEWFVKHTKREET